MEKTKTSVLSVVVLAVVAALSWQTTALAIVPVLNFSPTNDSTIDQHSPASNFGSSTQLGVRNRYGESGSDGWEDDTLVKFDLSSIASGTSVLGATLNLYYFGYWDNDPQGQSLTCYAITSVWDESTVTWNTQPTSAAGVTATAIVPAGPNWMSWDVTADVQDMVDGSATYYGWKIMDETYWGDSTIPYTWFYSKEFGQLTPYLEVTIPEPATLGLLLIGGLALLRHRRK